MAFSKEIYLDNAATTYCNGEVFYAMQPYFITNYGNPNSLHSVGYAAREAVEKARASVAKIINADPDEIYFTSGATEANNWVIKGIVSASPVKRILISAIEHPSITESARWLSENGIEVEYIKVDENGIISIPDLLAKLSKPTCLVSVMTANHEVGTVQYINTIANICSQNNVYFHTDATQALESVHINVKEMDITALSLSGHKIYGPKGVGALYIKRGTRIDTFMHGGHQEDGMRGGTYNLPAIVGLGKAVEICMRDGNTNNVRMKQLRDYFIKEIESKIQGVKLNGHRTQRLSNNVNFSFKGVTGESVVAMLDVMGVRASTGTASTSEVLSRSYVLQAIGVNDDYINGAVRFTIGRATTKEDIDFTVDCLIVILKKLRTLSPINIKMEVPENV
ncbi:MAG: cysteine desulfurase [Clostridia bacterium]|nr:cysteine desulfurase [Clostridia bacterium]